MRVVGGTWRGRPLTAPPGRGTRPTSDKVREAMFDVLLALPEVRDRSAAALSATDEAGGGPAGRPRRARRLRRQRCARDGGALARRRPHVRSSSRRRRRCAPCARISRGSASLGRTRRRSARGQPPSWRATCGGRWRLTSAAAHGILVFADPSRTRFVRAGPSRPCEAAGAGADPRCGAGRRVRRRHTGRVALERRAREALRRHAGHVPRGRRRAAGRRRTRRLMPSNVTAICPGTFDPVTVGHIDIITRGATKFGRVVVGLIEVPQRKSPLFTPEEREAFLQGGTRRSTTTSSSTASTNSSWSSRAGGMRTSSSKACEPSPTSSTNSPWLSSIGSWRRTSKQSS